jgi:hypothetical protein
MKIPVKLVFFGLLAIGLLFLGLLLLGKSADFVVSVPGNEKELATQSANGTFPAVPEEFAIPESENYTKLLADQFAGQIISLNQEGPQLRAEDFAILFNPEKVLNEMIAEALKKSPIEKPNLSRQNIRIVADSREAARAYTDNLQKIVNETIGDWNSGNPLVVFHRSIGNRDYRELISLHDRLKKAVGNLKDLDVPQGWADFHLEVLAVVIQTRDVIPRFLNWQEDPAGALVSLDAYQKIGEQTQNLFNEFVSRARKEGLL